MRFMFDIKTPTVINPTYDELDFESIDHITVTPVWCNERDCQKDTPSFFMIELYRPYPFHVQDDAIIGEIPLDNLTKEEVDKIYFRLRKAVDKAFTKGYVRESDFGNVEWC